MIPPSREPAPRSDAAGGEPALRVEGLTRRFGETVAVRDLRFQVRPGELFGLLGPDGAGKTTTLRMLAGVLRPSSGDALVHGVSVARDPERIKLDIAYMSQRFGLYGDLTVEENLRFYADLYRVPRAERPARLERLYRFSNLEPFRTRPAGRLSGGMKQKLGLSCALVHTPRLLLLDEPTFGVDPISRRDLWLIVHEMVSEGATAVVSTAYMDEAERFDRLALLHRGRILAIDTPDRLQSGLEGDVLEIEVAEPRRARDVLARHPRAQSAALFGHKLHVRVSSAQDDATALESALAEAGLTARSVRPSEPSMEDVFIERMGAADAAVGPSPTGEAP
jgi:ABC-2 type transport system ATP-binding protein